MKHRKLFPDLVANQSLACPDLCNSDCPYDCYPYSDTYSLPPPIPQPLLHPPPPLETTHRNISPYIIIASTFLGITLLLIIYYLIFIRNCFRRYSNDQDDSDTDSSNDIRLPTRIDHPIWHIRTVGLQPSMINSITVFNFKKGDKLIEGTDCSICLNEFQEGELLRLLPKCNHAFHIPCIDTWLRSHTSCPVCRALIVVSLAPTTLPSTDQNSVVPFESTETSQPGSSHNSETQEIIDIQPENSPALEVQDFNVNEEKLVKRCVSADSFPVSMSKMDMLNFHVNSEYQKSPYNHRSDICSTSRIYQRINDGATEAQSSYTDLRVKRSFSYGGRSFLSRHPQNSNLVLPL